MPSPATTFIQSFQHQLELLLHGGTIDLAPFFQPDAIWHLPRSADNWGGRDRIGRNAILHMLHSEVPQYYYQSGTMRFDYHHFTSEADRVHMHFTLHAITANGKAYTNEYQSLFRLKDQRIAEVWEYLDTAYLFGLLGPSDNA